MNCSVAGLLQGTGLRKVLTGRNVVFLIGVAAPAAHATGQDVPALTPACDQCRIAFDTVVELGDAAGPGMIEFDNLIVETDARGRYFVVEYLASSIKVFGADGVFEGSVGREGEGPGEFRFPYSVHALPDGRFFVSDRGQPRVSVFGPDLDLKRTIPLREVVPGFELLTLDGDSIVLTGHSSRADLFGLPVHVLTPEGRRVRSFGEMEGPIISDDPLNFDRAVALADRGQLWIALKNAYRVERWTLGGERVGALRGDVDWFQPIPENPDLPTPPRGMLSSIHQAADGLLWIKFQVPSKGWTEAFERDPETGRWRSVNRDARANTVTDVVDPETNRLLARGELHGRHTALFSGPQGEPMIGRIHVDMHEEQVRVLVLTMRLVCEDPVAAGCPG